jgi:hypothetical protein
MTLVDIAVRRAGSPLALKARGEQQCRNGKRLIPACLHQVRQKRDLVMRGILVGIAVLICVWAGRVSAQDFSGQWTCSYFSMNYDMQNRIERSYTMFLYPNGGYELNGTHVSSLIGIYERFYSRGEWKVFAGDGQPYVQAGGQANFDSGRNEHFVFWGWIRGPNTLASEYAEGNYQNQTSCSR